VAGSTYNQVLRLSVQGLKDLEKLELSARSVQRLLTDIKPIRSPFSDSRVGNDDVKKLAASVREYTANVAAATNTARTFTQTVKGKEKSTQIYSKTLGGLNAQLSAFKSLAANANVGQDDFNNAINAATKVQREFTQQRLKAAAAEASIGSGFVDDFIALNKTVPKSINGLNIYQKELQELLQTVEIGSAAYRKLSQEISRVDNQLGKGVEAEGRVQGPRLPSGRFTPETKKPRTSKAFIGAAFPLLFGGGPGAVAGGFIGELFGDLGGVVGSAVGGAVDSFVGETARTARALLTLEGTLDLVTQKSLAANLSEEKRLKTLSELGLSIDAEVQARKALEDVIGVGGVKDMESAGKSVDALVRQTNSNLIALGASLAPLIDITAQFLALLSRLPAFGGSGIPKELEQMYEFRQRLRTQTAKGAVPQSVTDRLRKRSSEIRSSLPKNRLGRVDESEVRKQLQPLIKQIEREYPILLSIQLTDKEKIQQEIESLQLELQSNELLISGIDAMQRLEKMANRRTELNQQEARARADLEKSLGDIQLSVQRRVQDMRMKNLQLEMQLRAQQAANEVRQLQLQNSIRQQSLKQNLVSSGTRPEVAQDALNLDQAFNEYSQKSLELENKKKQIQEQAVFNTLQVQLRVARFQEDTARRVADLKFQTQLKLDEIQRKRNEMDSVVGKAKFEAEKAAAEIRLNIIELEFKLLAEKLKQAGLETDSVERLLSTFKTIRQGFKDTQKDVAGRLDKSAAQPATGALGGVGTAGVVEAAREELEITDQINQAKLAGIELDKQLANVKRFATAQDIRLEIENQINGTLRNQQDEMTAQNRVLELVKGGMTEQVAIAVQQLEKQEEIALARLDNLELSVQTMEIDENDSVALENQRKELERIAELRGQLTKKFDTAKNNEKELKDPVKNYMKRLETEINDTRAMITSLAQTVESEISNAMSTAITGVITGTTTVEEAMSTMFANIGKAFIDMATQMIAKALILKALGALGGGNTMGGEGYYDKFTGLGTAGPNFGLADGGPTKPHGTYLVGERGPELLTMGNQNGFVHSNTSEAMDRYRAGGSGGGGGSLDVSYNVTQINGMNFVTEDQFRAGMSRAAKDGAKMGEAGTFRSMKNSRSSRRRVGI